MLKRINSFYRNAILVIVSLLVGVGIFIWLGKMIGWQQFFDAFHGFMWWQALVIITLTFLIAIVGNWRWQEILKDSGSEISFSKLFRIYLGGYAIMYLVPIILLAGEIFRAYALTREEKVRLPRSAASVIIERILEWTINLLVIFLGLFLFAFKLNILPNNILIVFGVALGLFIISLAYFYSKALRQKSIVQGIVRTLSKKEMGNDSGLLETEEIVFKFFQPKNKAFQVGLLLSILRASVMQLRTWILILFLAGIGVGFVKSLSILGFSYLSAMVPIPASLGSHELIQIVAFSSIGLAAATATAFTMIIRGCEVLVSLTGLAFIIKKGFNILGEKFNSNVNNNLQL
ncbi:MAG: lysylphosphatidylglycerol synthase transmembrane domain-containing protein, partial [Candidatus Pacebacteria bacterium]|nr:lysylphosphatidylglycerol synthase transmembrane domain-containing protein [Candidatus Paceibacterota bacterium]